MRSSSRPTPPRRRSWRCALGHGWLWTIDTASPARCLLLRGAAEIEVLDGPVPEYLQGAAKSMEGEELAAFEAGCRETYDRMARISIAPDWARYFDFAAGRIPDFLRALTSRE